MTFEDMTAIAAAIAYKPGWKLLLRRDAGQRPYLQLEVDRSALASLDATTRDGSRKPWRSGKRYLSKHMCRQEIVGAAFGLIRDAEEHEMREWFRYCGAAIYCPHLDPAALVDVARRSSSFNIRANAMTMEEPA